MGRLPEQAFFLAVRRYTAVSGVCRGGYLRTIHI